MYITDPPPPFAYTPPKQGLLLRVFLAKPATASVVRTTTALTVFKVTPSLPLSFRLLLSFFLFFFTIHLLPRSYSSPCSAPCQSGVKSNVLPAEAYALVNHRIHPKDTVASVMAHDKRVIDDPRVRLEVYGACTEPSPVSSAAHPAFADLRDSVG